MIEKDIKVKSCVVHVCDALIVVFKGIMFLVFLGIFGLAGTLDLEDAVGRELHSLSWYLFYSLALVVTFGISTLSIYILNHIKGYCIEWLDAYAENEKRLQESIKRHKASWDFYFENNGEVK